MRTICGAGIALLIAGVGTTARAETTVSILGIQALDAPAEVAARLADALRRRAASAPGYQLVKGKNLDEIKLVFGCVDEQPECMARVGRNLQADKLLWGTLRTSGGGYTLSLRFLDVANQRLDQSIEQPLSKADAARAEATIAQLTTAIFPAPHGAIRVSSNVVGAEISVGDTPKGLTEAAPTVVPALPPGDYAVTVRKKGYRVWQERVAVAAGKTVDVTAQLDVLAGVVPAPPPPRPAHRRRASRPPRADPRSGWKVAFWSTAALAVGLGVGVAVTGISVLDLEDDKTSEINVQLDRHNRGDIAFAEEVLRGLEVGGDACGVARQTSQKLTSICNDGSTREDIVNGLVAGTAVVGAVAAFFLYKAYIQPRPAHAAEERDELDEESRAPVRLITGVSPQGGHLGLAVSF